MLRLRCEHVLDLLHHRACILSFLDIKGSSRVGGEGGKKESGWGGGGGSLHCNVAIPVVTQA